MQLPLWIRTALCRTDNWCAELERLRRAVTAEPRGEATIERTVELAQASEHIDPDRGRALALYLAAWRAGHIGSRARVLIIARELRGYVTVAEVALDDHRVSGDPDCLVDAGRAFFDAGLLERAAETFARASEQRSPTASAITESVRLVDVRTLLALSRHEHIDPEREIAACMTRAQQAREDSGPLYLQAVRIARAAGMEASIITILDAAARRCPDDEEVGRLLEDRLLARGNAEEILEHYRKRFEATKGESQWVECVRAAACELVLRNIHPGLGLRLLRRSLEHAYAARLSGVPRHIAVWELLVAHARSSRATVDLAPLIAAGLAAPISEDDALYLSRLGLEIAWRDARDLIAAQPYAAAVLDRVPGHPLATKFLAEALPDRPPPPLLVLEAPPPPLAVMPKITFKTTLKIPRIEAPIPEPPPPPADATPRAARKVLPVDVVVELPTGAFFSTVVRDLSTSGAFVVTKREIAVGAVVALDLRLPSSATMTESSYRINAKVARRTDLGYGLAFVDASPELVAAIAAITGP